MGESDTLEDRIAKLKEILAQSPQEWNASKAHEGNCEEGWEGKHKEEKRQVITLPATENGGENSYCEEHSSYYKSHRDKFTSSLKELEEELKFTKILEKATRFSQFKDMVAATRAVISRENKRAWGEKKHFTDAEVVQGKKLLQALDKIQPESSQFLDRGVSINKDLYLSGTADESRGYANRGKSLIVLTALDQDERYKSIARVQLTIGEAERLRNLLVDCIEHVRIATMMHDLTQIMGVRLPGKEEGDEE